LCREKFGLERLRLYRFTKQFSNDPSGAAEYGLIALLIGLL
jgi:Flp pilus assembly pilin Flp